MVNVVLGIPLMMLTVYAGKDKNFDIMAELRVVKGYMWVTNVSSCRTLILI